MISPPSAPHEVTPPALVAVGTSLLSWLADRNWIGILGLCASAGWLVLGWMNYRLARAKFEAERGGR